MVGMGQLQTKVLEITSDYDQACFVGGCEALLVNWNMDRPRYPAVGKFIAIM
jgi:hypothetical protein